MKPASLTLRLLLLAVAPLLTDCAIPKKSAPAESTAASAPAKGKSKKADTQPLDNEATDHLDDYADAASVSDPLEGMNRVTFKINDGIYDFILRPISKGYVKITPAPVRQGLDNFFENAKFPVRFVNCGLQGKFKRAGQEAQKFGINTLAGLGGFLKTSDKVPALVAIPSEDTGQTLAKWGLGHGPYLVLPVFGPSSAREGVGFAGDYVLNPVNWAQFSKGNVNEWSWIPGTVNTIRSLPDQLYYYDEACKNSVDPYISVRSIYIQNRAAAVEQ